MLKYPILAKSITLLDSGTRLPALSTFGGQMSQDIAAGKMPRGEIIIEVYAHDVVIYCEKHNENGVLLEGQFTRKYVIPKSHCRVSLVDDDEQPEHLKRKLEPEPGTKTDAKTDAKLDAEIDAAKPRRSVVIPTKKAEEAKE